MRIFINKNGSKWKIHKESKTIENKYDWKTKNFGNINTGKNKRHNKDPSDDQKSILKIANKFIIAIKITNLKIMSIFCYVVKFFPKQLILLRIPNFTVDATSGGHKIFFYEQ